MIFVKCTMDGINVERYECDVIIIYTSPVNFVIRGSQYISSRERNSLINLAAFDNFHISLHEIMRAKFISCVGLSQDF